MKIKLGFATLPKTYEGLLAMHLLRPIRDPVDLENAVEMLEALAGHRLNTEQEDYLEALSTLVEAYERAHVPAPKLTGQPLVRHLLEANGLTAADLSRLLGRDRSLGVRLLSGERSLTIAHIKKLSHRFGLPVQAFIA